MLRLFTIVGAFTVAAVLLTVIGTVIAEAVIRHGRAKITDRRRLPRMTGDGYLIRVTREQRDAIKECAWAHEEFYGGLLANTKAQHARDVVAAWDEADSDARTVIADRPPEAEAC